MMCCDIFEVFDEEHMLIKEYAHWKLLVRNRNKTLGNCVVITKRHMENFSDITPDEMTEFAAVVKDIEHALKHAFQYDKINYQMLMMKESHLHFQVVPRYAGPRMFAWIEWLDAGWPQLPPANNTEVSAEVLELVRAEILKNMTR